MYINKKGNTSKCPINPIILTLFLQKLYPIENDKLDLNLLKDISDIIKLFESKTSDKFKYIYFNEKKINIILYEQEEVITIGDENISYFKNFENLFYFELLLVSNPDIINYDFSKNLIIEIFKIVNMIVKGIYNIIVNKIVINLINFYKSLEQYDEEKDEKELNDIENKCRMNFKENFQEFKKIGVDLEEDEILGSKIEEIYMSIIKALINSDKFEDYDYIDKIFREIKLDKIDLTKYMVDELNKILNLDSDLVKPYLIMKVEDLFNIKVVNFYNLLIKHLFHNSLYFYNVSLLLNTRKVIIFIFRKNLDLFCFFISKYEKDKILIERVDFLIQAITDNEYYYMKIKDNFRLCKLKAILFLKKYNFIDKQELGLENVVKNKLSEKYSEMLEEYKYVLDKFEIKILVINAMNKSNFTIGDLFFNQRTVEKAINSWELIEKTLKEKKFMKLRRDIKKNLLKLFENENISITLKKIFTEEQINLFLQLTFNLSQFREIQVNEDKSSSNLIARAKESVNVYFDYKSENSSSIIIQSYSLGENSKSNLSRNESKSNSNNIFNKKKEYNNWIASKSDKFKKSNKYQILEHYEVIGKHKSAEFSRELSNGEFLSGGNDKYLYWYDITFALKKKIYVDNNQYNLYEIKSRDNNNKDEINIISFSEKRIYYIRLDLAKNESYIDGKIKNSSVMSVYYLDYKSSLILGQNKLGKFNNQWKLFDSTIETIKNEINIYFRGGILLRNEFEKYFILTSTENIPKGENIMILYNYTLKKSTTIVEGYSFYPSFNNVCEISQIIQIEKKLILAVCQKKENDGQYKNGILAVNLKINGKIRFSTDFYHTNNFEPYCFCQILKVENNNSIYRDIANVNNIIIKETEYVLVGGFDRDKREGCIKLYKIGINDDDHLIIKYIQDIYIEQGKNFKGFNGQISSIVQSRTTGNIIVTCWDGNVHLFKPPNLEILNE